MAVTMAGPVMNTRQVYTQPDGTQFSVRVTGDEWLCIRTTEDGCAIARDPDLWWCYGVYDGNGCLVSTGHHVGYAPADIIAASKNIPYESLSQKAAAKRARGREQSHNAVERLKSQIAQTRSGSTSIHKKGIALLVEFSDTKFTHSRNDIINLLNQSNYNGTGSAKDYYEDQFGDGWEFSFDVSDIITLKNPARHYGENLNEQPGADTCPWDMVTEACKAADPHIDFSSYDQDKDGFVDNIYVFYAGKAESENTDIPDLIWPHQYYILSGEGIRLTCDGKHIDRYACSAEISGEASLTGIGSFCHEFGHTMGLVDLYDTDYENNGWAAGTWRTTSLMDGGNYNNMSATPPNFNCIERELLGLSSPVMLEEGKTYTLTPIHKEGLYYRMDTDTEGEYFLFECRSDEGWDRYIGGKGMLAYHIDKNAEATDPSADRWKTNMVNAYQSHQCADLLEADGRRDLIMIDEDFKVDIRGIFYPRHNITSISSSTMKYWNGGIPDLLITGIELSEGNISFNVIHNEDKKEMPQVTDAACTVFPDAAVIRFASSDTSLEGTPVLKWKKSGSKTEYTADINEYESGKYACKLEGLESGKVSYEVSIYFKSAAGLGKIRSMSFMTKGTPSVSWPLICFGENATESGEGITVHVTNAAQAEEINWTFNSEPLVQHDDYRIRPASKGTLKAEIMWTDGSRDIIVKQL